MDLQVYEDGNWRIRDILGHLATWDRQVSLSLNAYRQGNEYAIPDFNEDSFNNVEFERQNKITSEEILDEWQAAREGFKAAVRNIPQELYPGDLLYPWGDERGTVENLVNDMAGHDLQHYSEILNAVKE